MESVTKHLDYILSTMKKINNEIIDHEVILHNLILTDQLIRYLNE